MLDSTQGFQEIKVRQSSDFSGDYYSDDYYLRSSIKQREREAVVAFMLQTIPEPHPLAVVSMPGLSWAFEQQLILQRPGTHIVGIERSQSVYLNSRRLMPYPVRHMEHFRTELSERSRQLGRHTYVYSRASNVRTSKLRRNHRLLWMPTSLYTTALLTDFGQTKVERGDFYFRFYSRSAAWFDWQGQLSAEIETTIQNLHFCMKPDGREKPVVFTFMGARDHYHSTEERLARIRELQPAFVLKDHWTYSGKSGVPMLTVCGTII